MLEPLLGALLIMCLRICDVTLGTFRTLLVVQGKKYQAGFAGFFEVLIWITAMKYIVQHLDPVINIFAYAAGFAMGVILGITLEQKFSIGFAQVTIISRFAANEIVKELRQHNFGATLIPGEGGHGDVSILLVIARRKFFKDIKLIAEGVDKECFISIQSSQPYRGYMHGARK